MERDQPPIHIAGSEGSLARIDEALRQPIYIDPDPKPDEKLETLLRDPEAYFREARARTQAAVERDRARRHTRMEAARREVWQHSLLGRLSIWMSSHVNRK